MKTIAIAILLLASGPALRAQQRMSAEPIHVAPPPQVPGAIRFTFGSISGSGNVVLRGYGNQPALTNPFSFQDNFATRQAATITAFPGFTDAQSGGSFQPSRGDATVVVRYPYPIYMGAYGDPSAQPQPNVTILMPPYPDQAVPPVTINQYFVPEMARPTSREYAPGAQETVPAGQSGLRNDDADATPDRASEDQVLFFIALKDSTIYTAVVAYYVEDGTLHYINYGGKHNQVSLDLVDRDLTAKLNRARQVEFRLPPAAK